MRRRRAMSLFSLVLCAANLTRDIGIVAGLISMVILAFSCWVLTDSR